MKNSQQRNRLGAEELERRVAPGRLGAVPPPDPPPVGGGGGSAPVGVEPDHKPRQAGRRNMPDRIKQIGGD